MRLTSLTQKKEVMLMSFASKGYFCRKGSSSSSTQNEAQVQ